MNVKCDIDDYFNLITKTLSMLDKDSIVRFIDLLNDTYQRDKDIYIFGNGGSGSSASHITGDFLKGVSYGLEKRFKFFCLNDNIPTLMAIANDIGYSDIFVEQLKNYLSPGDMVVGISGSGNSANVIRALKFAKKKDAVTVAFCGYNGGKVSTIADLVIHVPVEDMEVCEDVHLIIAHCCKKIIKKSIGKVNMEGRDYAKRIHM